MIPAWWFVHDAARPLVSPALIDAAVIGLDSTPELHALIASRLR